MIKNILKYFPAVLFSFILILIWEYYSKHFAEGTLFFPSPTQVLNALVLNREVLLVHTIQTALETFIGLSIAIILGFVMSLVLSMSSRLRRILYPFLIFSQTIPLIALAPLLLIWFGFDLTPKVIMVVLFCFFPITLVFTGALMAVQSDYINLLESMNATKWQILNIIRIPFAMPSFFSGLKIAATYAMTGAIVGEFVGGFQGLGIYMETASNSHSYAPVFAAIVVASGLTIFLVLMVSIIEKLVIPWHFHKSK